MPPLYPYLFFYALPVKGGNGGGGDDLPRVFRKEYVARVGSWSDLYIFFLFLFDCPTRLLIIEYLAL